MVSGSCKTPTIIDEKASVSFVLFWVSHIYFVHSALRSGTFARQTAAGPSASAHGFPGSKHLSGELQDVAIPYLLQRTAVVVAVLNSSWLGFQELAGTTCSQVGPAIVPCLSCQATTSSPVQICSTEKCLVVWRGLDYFGGLEYWLSELGRWCTIHTPRKNGVMS